MEIAAQLAQGITDASPILGAEWIGAESHGGILPGLAAPAHDGVTPPSF